MVSATRIARAFQGSKSCVLLLDDAETLERGKWSDAAKRFAIYSVFRFKPPDYNCLPQKIKIAA
jgi:hypothetical protein